MLLFYFILLFLLCGCILFFAFRGFGTQKYFVLLCVLLTGAAGGLYSLYGSFSAEAQIRRDQEVTRMKEKLIQTFQTPAQLEARIKEKLKADPTQIMGWVLLGRLEESQAHFNEAKEAFEHVIHLQDINKINSDLWLQYAHALFFAEQKQETPKLIQVIGRIQKQAPEHPGLLNLRALIAFSKKDYGQAIQYWQKLLVLLPEESQVHDEISKAILKAQTFNHLNKHVPN